MKITSIEAYEQVKKDGTLKKIKLQVYKFVCEHPNCTQDDMNRLLQEKKESFNSGILTTRFSELERMGFIKVTGKIKQGRFNRHTYEITGRIKPISEEMLLSQELIRIENQISRLYAKAGAIRIQIAKLNKTDQLGLGV